MKPIHGEPTPLWKKFELQEFPPIQCDFVVGDRVVYTNDYGLKFDMEIVGFSEDTSFYGRFIHIIRDGSNGDGSAWWFPHKPSELTKK